MSDKKSRPIRSLFKYCWYCLAVIIILVAIIVQTARWLAPTINQFKDSIEAFASRQLNSNIDIGQISASWEGLRPKLSIKDLSIQYQSTFLQNQASNRNKNFLDIKYVSLELDILRSLFYWVPVWHDVEANGITAQLLQDINGGWSLGIPVAKEESTERNWRYRRPGSLFLAAQHVKLNDAGLTLVFSDKREIKSRVPSVIIKNNGHFHRLEAKASVANESSFTLIVEGVGDPSIPDKFFAKAYVKLENFAEQRLAQLFSQLTSFNIEQEWIHTSHANVELWFDFASTTRFLMNGHIDLKGVNSVIDELQAQDDDKKGNNWSADIVGGYNPTTGLDVGLRNINIGESFSVAPFTINLKDTDKINVGIEALNLERSKEWVLNKLFHLPFFNDDKFSVSKIKDLLTSLNPQGAVNNLYMTIDINDPKKTKLFAYLDNVTTGVWQNIPAFDHVSGYVESDRESGFVVIDAKDFSLFPDKTYSQPIVAKLATGVVGWTLNHSEKEVTVFGYDLSLQGDYGDAKGNFLLESSWSGSNHKNQIILQLGLKNSKASFHTQLVPKTLPENILSWMDAAIKDGELVNTGVIYKGGFAKTSPRSIQVFVDVKKGKLKFDKNWPEVNQLNAKLLIDNNHLFAVINNASAYSNDNFNGKVSWNVDSEKLLKVDVEGSSPADSALQYIRESALKNNVGDVVDYISAKGNVNIKVNLHIPLENSSANEKNMSQLSKQDVEVVFKDNVLSFDKQSLNFNFINGSLRFENNKGFSSKGLQSNFFGKPLFIDLHEDSKDRNALIISGKGSASIQSINDWLNQPFLSYLKGDINYNADIRIPLNMQAKIKPVLSITSDMVGVTSALPKPFKKLAKDKLSLKFMLPFTDDKLIYELQVGSYLATKFAFGGQSTKDNKISAFFSVSDTSVDKELKLPASGIKVFGKFEDFSVDEWLPVFTSISAENESSNNTKTDKLNFDASLFVSINNMRIKDQVLKKIIFSGEREVSRWRLIVDNNDVLGSLTIDDNSQKPLRLELDYLNWPPDYNKSVDASNTKGDPLEGIDSSLFPAIAVKVNRLNVLGKSLGAWSFDVVPDKQGVDFRNIYGVVPEFKFVGVTPKNGGFLRWDSSSDKTSASTSVYGSIIGRNPKVLFEQWNLPVVLESKKTQIDFNLSWPGSPLAIELETLTGKMTHSYEDGVFSQENIDNSSGLLRVFGLLNFNSWARRVRLDFSDIYKKGFTFDELSGQLYFNNGLMTLTQPLKMQGPSSLMELSGVIDYPKQTVDANLEASLPLGGNLTLIAALTAGLPVAAGVYIASKIFKKQLKLASTIKYNITGDLNNPTIGTEKNKASSAANSEANREAGSVSSLKGSNDQ